MYGFYATVELCEILAYAPKDFSGAFRACDIHYFREEWCWFSVSAFHVVWPFIDEGEKFFEAYFARELVEDDFALAGVAVPPLVREAFGVAFVGIEVSERVM